MLFRDPEPRRAEVSSCQLVALAVDAWKTFAEVRREGGHALLYCRGVRRDGRQCHPVRPVAAPSARPGSPNSMAEARRLRRVPTAALLRSLPSRDYLMPSAVMRCAVALTRVAERRWPSDTDRAPAVRGRLRTLGKRPGPPVRLRAPHPQLEL